MDDQQTSEQSHQRSSRRWSNSKAIGRAIRMRLKSGCSGLSRKFVSSGLIALGKAKTAERRSCTQRSPISIVSAGGGVTRQLDGSLLIGKISVRLSGHS